MCRTHNYAALYLVLLLMLLIPGLAICVESPEVIHLNSISEGLHAPIRIAMDAVGNAYAVWQDRRNGANYDIYSSVFR